MMKPVWLLLVAIGSWTILPAQNIGPRQTDSLHRQLSLARHDTVRILIMSQLAEAYRGEKNDSTLVYASQALEQSRRIRYAVGESKALSSICHYFWNRGNLPAALDAGLRALRIARDNNLRYEQGFAMIRVGNVYNAMNDHREALKYYRDTRKLVEHTPDSFFYAVTLWLSSEVYAKLNEIDSALEMAHKAYDTASKMNNALILSQLPNVMGELYAGRGDDRLAVYYYRQSIDGSTKRGEYNSVAKAYLSMSRHYRGLGNFDSAIWYARQSYTLGRERETAGIQLEAAGLIAELFDTIDARTSLTFLKIANNIQDSLFGTGRIREAQALSFAEKERQNEISAAEAAYHNRIRQFMLIIGIGLMALLSVGLYRNNRTKQIANQALQEQKLKVEEALSHLKSAQSQLVQSEKMASLGELTAGIAHEIQNPLNFVNNFSDLNQELIDELEQELDQGDIREVKTMISNLRENESKINLHGKRADGIVKSMLQHSRSSTGQKEMTDVNRLADEYTRLAYQGYRARLKEFDVTLDMDLDPGAGEVKMVSQDIGRVLLNLLNNAFYAVQEKTKMTMSGYKPRVSVRTRRNPAGTVIIEIEDNGSGIADSVKEKIFQPFFTTKPAGQGTGLGLSLSYDIVTKGNGGSLYVASTGKEGTIISIVLPAE
jgi:two-component system, NtrC family, sensor kinase